MAAVRAGDPARRAAPSVLRSGALAMVGWSCPGGCAFLVSSRAQDSFHLAAGTRGLLLTAFGVAGILTVRPVSRVRIATRARARHPGLQRQTE
ncbi:MAG: hypothetical protein ACRDQ5_06750 [Sciscionella sp.]